MQKKINEEIKSDLIKRVWIGDPCYVISDKLWDSVCAQIFKNHNEEVGFKIEFDYSQIKEAGISLLLDGLPLQYLQCGTMHGDGGYPSQSGFNYGVDSGCLAIIPDYLIAPEKLADAEELGKFFDVQGGIRLVVDGEGYFNFFSLSSSEGRLTCLEVIYTGDSDEDEEYEDEDYCRVCGSVCSDCQCDNEEDQEEEDIDD